jgi:hypothetical protein
MKTSAIPQSSGEVSKKLLKFTPGGPSVEEARAAMLAAREPATTTRLGTKVPTFIQGAATDNSETPSVAIGTDEPSIEILSEAEAVLNPESAPVQQTPQVQRASVSLDKVSPQERQEAVEEPQATPEPKQPSAKTERKRYRNEQKKFTYEIYQDRGKHIAEIVYDPLPDGFQPGTERFEANSMTALIAQLADGKANSTLKIRQQNQRLKTASVPDDWNVFYGAVKKMHGMSQAQYDALPLASRVTILDTVQAVEIQAFLKEYPEFVPPPNAHDLFYEWANKNKLPLTLKNMEIAYRELRDDGKLKVPAANSGAAPTAAASTTASTVPNHPSVPAETSVLVGSAPAQPPVAYAAPPGSQAPATPPAATRKRGAYTTGLIPGSSSATRSDASNQNQASSGMDEAQARELSKTPEGMAVLRKHLVQNEWGKRGKD